MRSTNHEGLLHALFPVLLFHLSQVQMSSSAFMQLYYSFWRTVIKLKFLLDSKAAPVLN